MPESGRKLATCDMPLRVDGDAHDVISSQQPVDIHISNTDMANAEACVLRRSRPSNELATRARLLGLTEGLQPKTSG